MKKWEYKGVCISRVLAKYSAEEIQNVSNELGKEGWEMVGFDGVENGNIVVIFKRELEQ